MGEARRAQGVRRNAKATQKRRWVGGLATSLQLAADKAGRRSSMTEPRKKFGFLYKSSEPRAKVFFVSLESRVITSTPLLILQCQIHAM